MFGDSQAVPEASSWLRPLISMIFRVECANFFRSALGTALRDKGTSGERVGNIRFGLRLSPDGKHEEPDPGEQAVLREIRRLRQDGHTLRGIAAALNHKALQTRLGCG